MNYLRLGWFAQPDELSTAAPLLEQFRKQTGIGLRNIPVPESTLDQLDLSRKLLEGGASSPDVLGIDLIWSGALAADLMDLRPYFADEMAQLAPQSIPSYMVNGKLVAIPYGTTVGVLEYRSDLLREYGYAHPPKTWDELERMAERIQAGQRAKGDQDFWGFVWQGGAAEALTCNALEWQAAEGGGRIVEDDGSISVNNPKTIRAWLRAKRWIGWISPPGVVAYRETDSANVFDHGEAAFHRIWGGISIASGGQPRLLHLRDSLTLSRVGYTSLPAGPDGHLGTLGGSGVAISRNSPHPREAIQLARFLIRSELHNEQEESKAKAPSLPLFYDLPTLAVNDKRAPGAAAQQSGSVARPSAVTGDKYEQVTRAYLAAVHATLTGKKTAAQAAAELEKSLVEITHLKPGKPKPVN